MRYNGYGASVSPLAATPASWVDDHIARYLHTLDSSAQTCYNWRTLNSFALRRCSSVEAGMMNEVNRVNRRLEQWTY